MKLLADQSAKPYYYLYVINLFALRCSCIVELYVQYIIFPFPYIDVTHAFIQLSLSVNQFASKFLYSIGILFNILFGKLIRSRIN